ncbi:MAG TPA: tRNA lysidine(34) synthetase TilS [Pirellulales bacterium]|nr:tRNA lysidine(34) synthetase TilS [Pirellulales bacterium]
MGTENQKRKAENRSSTLLAGLWLPADWCDVTVLVAVSGGADSVALLRALAALRPARLGRLVVAHFNHALRGHASDADAVFVTRLAENLGLPLEIEKADPDILAPALGDRKVAEETARNARYQFLKTVAARRGARYVATAHTADDQAETVLHRIVRGTGLSGLAGMRRSRPLLHGVSLIRPLLGLRRADLLSYLQRLDQPFCEDATNRDAGFTRNRLRQELLPQLAADYNPQVIEALLRLARLADEAQEVIAAVVDNLAPRCLRSEPTRLVVDCAAIAHQPRYVVREILVAAWRRQQWPEQAMGFKQWDELANLVLPAKPGSSEFCAALPGGVHACRDGDTLVISRAGAPTA